MLGFTLALGCPQEGLGCFLGTDETGEGDTYCWVEIPAAAIRLGSPQEGRGRIDSLQSSRLTTSYTSNSSKLRCGFLHFADIVSVYFGDITKSCPAIQSHSSQWQRQHRMFAQPQDSYLLVWKLRFSLKYPENLLWHFICALFCVFWWRHHPRRALKKFWAFIWIWNGTAIFGAFAVISLLSSNFK